MRRLMEELEDGERSQHDPMADRAQSMWGLRWACSGHMVPLVWRGPYFGGRHLAFRGSLGELLAVRAV